MDKLTGTDNGWLRFNEEEARWSVPDPTHETRTDAAWKLRYQLDKLTQHEAFLLAEVFEAYHHLCTHPAGTRYTQAQLASIRRAIFHGK